MLLNQCWPWRAPRATPRKSDPCQLFRRAAELSLPLRWHPLFGLFVALLLELADNSAQISSTARCACVADLTASISVAPSIEDCRQCAPAWCAGPAVKRV